MPKIIWSYNYPPCTPHLGVIEGQNHEIGFQNPELSQLFLSMFLASVANLFGAESAPLLSLKVK